MDPSGLPGVPSAGLTQEGQQLQLSEETYSKEPVLFLQALGASVVYSHQGNCCKQSQTPKE